jgi:fluoroacetyl-CoA thioesterase
MPRPVPISASGEAEETVEEKHTLSAHHPELPPVYSTPDMIRLMETACFFALQPYCDEGEITVGTAIHVEHRAASGIGMRVRARAELESFDGRFYTMRVTAHDGLQEIGRGTIGRAVVHVPTFVARMEEKTGLRKDSAPIDARIEAHEKESNIKR